MQQGKYSECYNPSMTTQGVQQDKNGL